MQRFVLVCVLLAAGCATPVTYYQGTATYTSTDGRIPYNKTEVLLKRELTGSAVLETRTEAAPSPAMPPRTTVTRQPRATAGQLRLVRPIGSGRPMQVVEQYRPVSQAAYEQALAAMRPPKGAE